MPQSALYYMAFDLLEGVLSRAHRLDDVSTYVVSTMRELTGAHAVALFAGREDAAADDRILALSPERKRAVLTPGMCREVVRFWRSSGKPSWLAVTEVAKLSPALVEVAQHGLTILSLVGMDGESGAIVLFDPPERGERLTDVFTFVKPLQTLLGMVLGQSLLLDRQERTIAERTAALARSEVFYRTVFEASPIAIALADPSTGHLQDVNAAFSSMTGRSRAELVGQHHSIIHDSAAARTADGSVLSFAEGRADPGPARADSIVLPNGQRREVEIRTHALGEVSPPTLLAFFDDVTEQNRLRREERRLQEELHESQKMEALGTLAGGVAHDFNNLLSSIRGFTELALMDLTDRPEQCEQLAFVMRAADRAKELVQQILTFSRRSLGERVVLSLSLVAEEALRLMQSTLPSNITCKFDGRQQDCTVKAHPAQLHQIVMNLCTNAVHAMRPAGGTLAVNVARQTILADADLNPGDYVVLSVADTGVGMDAETLGRVFEPYFTTKPKGQGTGLGLSVVHGIVKNLGGRIRVRSLPGQGTTFVLLLPAASEEVAPQAPDPRAGPRGTARILLVDDDPNLTRLAERMLEPLGYHVTSVNDSRAALDLWSRSPESYDLLISDQVMPELSGAELVKQVLASRPNLPVIVWSGYSEDLDPESARVLGVRAYLMKPFTRAQLADAVASALSPSG